MCRRWSGFRLDLEMSGDDEAMLELLLELEGLVTGQRTRVTGDEVIDVSAILEAHHGDLRDLVADRSR